MNTTATIRVLVVDDHDLVRSGIARMLEDEADMHVVGQANCGEEALEILARDAVDVVLMDVKMPGMGGIEATQRITQQYPQTNVVAMSSMDIGVIPSQMLSAGALGFITKSASVDEMLKAIRAVAAGNHYVTESVATQLALDPFNRKKKRMFEKLSQRELQISMLLSDGQKVSRISEFLNLSPKTVYSYRYRIFEKLGIRSDVELTILAMRNGLCESSEDILQYGERRESRKSA